MKKIYFFFLIFAIYLHSNGQSNCAKANSDLVYGYSHIKTADDANNLENLKLWSSRALESFNQVKVKLEACTCEKSYKYIQKILERLNHIENSESFEESQSLIKKSRGITKELIMELELCTKLELEKYSSR